jgi:hypothetical protein
MSDPTLNVQLLIENIFRSLMPSESARHHFRIKGISERWIGLPAWYLWFDDLPGCFLLEIREACMFPVVPVPRDQPPGKHSMSRGILGIKYYPDTKDKKAFQAFSHAEREIRASDSFDETGTPAFDHVSDIPDTFFEIGAMEVLVAEGRRFAFLSLHAPSVWRVYRIDGRTTSASSSVLQGVLDREVPSWSWSWFLFDRLLAAICFVYKAVPLCVDLLEQEGKAFVVDHENRVTGQGDPNVTLRSLMGGFLLPDELFPERKEDRDNLFYLRQQVLNADHFVNARHVLECVEMPREALPWINPGWWRPDEDHLTLQDTSFC